MHEVTKRLEPIFEAAIEIASETRAELRWRQAIGASHEGIDELGKPFHYRPGWFGCSPGNDL